MIEPPDLQDMNLQHQLDQARSDWKEAANVRDEARMRSADRRLHRIARMIREREEIDEMMRLARNPITPFSQN